MADAQDNKRPFKEDLKRGLLIGGAVGVIGGIFYMDIRHGLVLGLIGGFFAVLTRRAIDKKRGG